MHSAVNILYVYMEEVLLTGVVEPRWFYKHMLNSQKVN